jgi:hypothetical protein
MAGGLRYAELRPPAIPEIGAKNALKPLDGRKLI